MKCHILSQDQPQGGLDQRYLYNKMTRLGVWLVFFICASFNIELFIYFFLKVINLAQKVKILNKSRGAQFDLNWNAI